ncbi:DMT family transporter [Alteromonadaceae bacterium M269]|nr:DMT family transporter [Alteromonadaceae bacterium M269]
MSVVLKGAILLVLAEACFAGLGAMVKHLSDHLDQTQLVFFRNFFALVTVLPWLFKAGIKELPTPHWKLHLFRAFLGLVAMYCFFYVIAHMPFGQAILIILTAPFIIPVICRFWLNESITKKTLVAIVIAFSGAAASVSTESTGFNQYVLIALLGSCLMATTKVTIRKLTSTEPTGRIVFYFAALGTLVTFIPMLSNWKPVSLIDWFWLTSIGVLAMLGQVMMTKSFRLVSPARIGLLTNVSVVFAAFLGYVIWDEPITTGLILGAGLIFWAGSITTRQRWFI